MNSIRKQWKVKSGIVFFVPLGAGSKYSITRESWTENTDSFPCHRRSSADIDTKISEFGINNAYVEVNILLTVNVQIIVPLATKKSVVKQKIPVAIGLIQSTVPQIYTTGGGSSTID